MGSNPLKSIARVALATTTYGMSEALGVGKKLAGQKQIKVGGTAAAEVAEEKAANIKRRKALYETEGGVLGEEVKNVGAVGRKNLFGN